MPTYTIHASLLMMISLTKEQTKMMTQHTLC